MKLINRKIYLTIGEYGSVKSIFVILLFSGSANKALYTFSFNSISVPAPHTTRNVRLPSEILKKMFSDDFAVKTEVRVEKSVGNLVKRAIAASPLFGSFANTEGTFNLKPPGKSKRLPVASINWPLNVAIGIREVTETETSPEIQLREISTLLTQGKVLMRLEIFRTSMRASGDRSFH